MTRPPVVGIVGYGLLGAAIAHRTTRTDWETIVYDVNRPTDVLERATIVDALGEVSDTATAIIVSVYSAAEVADVLAELGNGGGRTILCATTVEPARVGPLEVAALLRNWRLIFYPLCGTSRQVAAGDSLGLVGAQPASVSPEVLDLTRVVTPRLRFFDRPAEAVSAKLAVNLVLELNRTALAEGLAFAMAMGIEPARALEVLQVSPAESAVMRAKGPKMIGRNFEPEGRLRQSLKDVSLMMHEAEASGLKLHLLEAQRELLERCCDAGDGEMDSSAVALHMTDQRSRLPAC